MKFEATYDEEGRFLDGNLVGNWEVLDVHLPQALEAQRDSVMQLIREGLEAMGNDCCRSDSLKAINIHFKNYVAK